MSLLKYLERIKRMDDLIRRCATGNSTEFANKLGISRSVLMENLREMRELGACIEYSHHKQSYYYEKEFRLIIGPSRTAEAMLFGGEDILLKMRDVSSILYYRTHL
jgi:hypothetical protein